MTKLEIKPHTSVRENCACVRNSTNSDKLAEPSLRRDLSQLFILVLTDHKLCMIVVHNL